MYDFIVSGAGPVGSYLAYRLSEKWNIAVLEEHAQIGVPVACSGMVSGNIWNHIPSNEKLIQNTIKGARAHNKRTYIIRKSDTEAFVLDRQKLDEYIASLAAKNGAKIMTNARLNSFDVSDKVVCDVSGKQIEGKMLAGCDGPLSVVRKGSGISDPNFLHGLFVYTKEEDFDDMVDVWYDVPGFFSWKVPRGKNGSEWGLAIDPKLNAMKFFEKFRKDHNLESLTQSNIHSGMIPWGNVGLSGNRTFLCGDAGSQTKAYSGGGIMYGIMAAKIASETIDPNNQITLKTYERSWSKEMGRELWFGRRMKWLYSHRNLLEASLKTLKLMNHQKLHMDKPSTILKFP